MSQEEKGEPGRAEGRRKKETQTRSCVIKTQPIPWARPQPGEEGLFSRENGLDPSIDKIHCMAQLTDFSQRSRGEKNFPS